MQAKTLIQLFFFTIIILISFFFVKTYFVKENKVNKKVNKIEKVKPNTIEDISYSYKDLDGNTYNIVSEFTEINNNQSNLIIMKNVKAKISLKNDSPIIIYSKNALYNNKTHYTNFFDDVKMNYNLHSIKSDAIVLNFQKGLMTISNNVIYNYLKTSMEADKIEVNLIDKNSRIFMNNKKKQIKIINKN
tara:strand:- start:61 stop:627 length:567 start_codon:yes stop_codon:yes gene_type:complete